MFAFPSFIACIDRQQGCEGGHCFTPCGKAATERGFLDSDVNEKLSEKGKQN